MTFRFRCREILWQAYMYTSFFCPSKKVSVVSQKKKKSVIKTRVVTSNTVPLKDAYHSLFIKAMYNIEST